MKTVRLKENGKKLMAVGGTIFFGGFGMFTVAGIVERSEKKIMRQEELFQREKKLMEERNAKECARLAAEEAKNNALASQIAVMDKKEFAKFKADADAKASKEAIEQAKTIRKEAEEIVSKMKLECSRRIIDMEADCAKKVEDATEKYMDARKKADDIEKLFNNKDEILRAQKKLEKLAKKKSEEERDYSELIEKLEDLFDE